VRAIPVKWVFETKRNVDGNVERYKARLVAKGFRQLEGVDFTKVFAPVSKHATLRALLARVAHHDMELHQLDIKTAFLNGQLEEEVYVEQLPGYAGGGAGKVCRLHRALYGLKQAPRAWHKRLSEELNSLGVTAASADAGQKLNFPTEDLERRGGPARRSGLQRPLRPLLQPCPPPPGYRSTVRGFFPSVRWVFYADQFLKR